MPGPLTKSVCVLYLTFSRANSMLCLPSARCPVGTGGRLSTGGGSGASHHARCRREHTRVGTSRAGGAGVGRPGSFRRACQCCLVRPLGACRPGWWLCRPLGTGDGCRAGHGRDLPAVAMPVRRVPRCQPLPLPAVGCAAQSGPSLMLCSGALRALAPRVPTAPSAWGTWWLWHAWGTLHTEPGFGC